LPNTHALEASIDKHLDAGDEGSGFRGGRAFSKNGLISREYAGRNTSTDIRHVHPRFRPQALPDLSRKSRTFLVGKRVLKEMWR